jgi:hypothetical protein
MEIEKNRFVKKRLGISLRGGRIGVLREIFVIQRGEGRELGSIFG